MPEIGVVHAYPAARAFLNSHGPEAVAVLDDLVAHAELRDGVLVVTASVRQVAARLVFTSKDTVNRRLRELAAAGVITRLAPDASVRFACPVYALHLDGTGISLSVTPTAASSNTATPRIDTMALTPLSQPATDECTNLRGTGSTSRGTAS